MSGLFLGDQPLTLPGGWEVYVGADRVYPTLNMVALPLTYDEEDYAGTMTWVRQGNGPHVTPQGFEGDGYGAQMMSTTIPAWMQPASAVLTMHASVSFYPQQLKSTSEFVVCAGSTDAFSKLILCVRPDVSNSKISQLALRGGTGGTSYVEQLFSRSGWRYQGRNPDLSVGGYNARPQAIGFLDADTMLLTCHFQDTRSRIYKIRLSDFAVLGSFDSTDYPHVANMAKRSNGDWWFGLNNGRMGRVDLDTSFATGTLTLSAYSALPDSGAGAIEFVTVGGTEYLIVGQYLTAGTPYFWVFPASLLGNATIAAADRYKRFTGCPGGIQGCCMRSGKLLTSSLAAPGGSVGSLIGYIGRFDIVTAITSTVDGAALTSEQTLDAASAFTEDMAVHPTTNEVWTPIEGITSAGSDASGGGMTVWSSPLDGSLVENHYTCEYDGTGATVIRINNRAYDTMDGALAVDVACVTVGGPPDVGAGITNRYFTGFVRNLVLQDQPMTSSQYSAAVNGDYEPNSLAEYEFVLTNPGAESGTTTGWTNESGGIGVLEYPTNSATVPHSGTHFFSGGTSASTIARQRLDVLTQMGLVGADVDAGGLWAKVRWWQASFNSSEDPAGMGLRALNGSNASLSEAYSGIVWMPNSSGSYRPWYPRCFSADLPAGTRNLDALIKVTRTAGTNNDGWIDDVRVTVYKK